MPEKFRILPEKQKKRVSAPCFCSEVSERTRLQHPHTLDLGNFIHEQSLDALVQCCVDCHTAGACPQHGDGDDAVLIVDQLNIAAVRLDVGSDLVDGMLNTVEQVIPDGPLLSGELLHFSCVFFF